MKEGENEEKIGGTVLCCMRARRLRGRKNENE